MEKDTPVDLNGQKYTITVKRSPDHARMYTEWYTISGPNIPAGGKPLFTREEGLYEVSPDVYWQQSHYAPNSVSDGDSRF